MTVGTSSGWVWKGVVLGVLVACLLFATLLYEAPLTDPVAAATVQVHFVPDQRQPLDPLYGGGELDEPSGQHNKVAPTAATVATDVTQTSRQGLAAPHVYRLSAREQRGKDGVKDAAVNPDHVRTESRVDFSDPHQRTRAFVAHASSFHTKTNKRVWPDNAPEYSSLQPRIIGIGTQKGGTTSLGLYLDDIAWIERGRSKELHFFDKGIAMTQYVNRTFDPVELYLEYLSRWRNASAATECTGRRCRLAESYTQTAYEITPVYMVDRRAPWLMQQILPHMHQVKLVVVLRDPASRALSGFFQGVKKGASIELFNDMVPREIALLRECYNATLRLEAPELAGEDASCRNGFDQYLALHKCAKVVSERDNHPWYWGYLQLSLPNETLLVDDIDNGPQLAIHAGHLFRGLYVDQIKNFLCAGFRPDQFLFITATQLHEDQLSVLRSISAFIGREYKPASAEAEAELKSGITVNHKSRGQPDPEVTQALEQLYAPYNKELVNLLLSNPFHVDEEWLLREFRMTPADVPHLIKPNRR
eukprot:m.168660 g.168660  ORF g.168660 m.168660 type:complete len:532 (+) comp14481_c0_seq1:198-1793(+)